MYTRPVALTVKSGPTAVLGTLSHPATYCRSSQTALLRGQVWVFAGYFMWFCRHCCPVAQVLFNMTVITGVLILQLHFPVNLHLLRPCYY